MFWALIACGVPVAAAHGAPGRAMRVLPVPTVTDAIRFRAQGAACDAQGCQLQGDARIESGPMLLRADALTLCLDANGLFGGAMAQGHVLFDDGLRTLQSDAIKLAADGTTAQLRQGVLRLRSQACPRAQLDEAGLPAGPFALTVTGDLVRDATGEITARHSTLTLCDCGRGRAPSWQLYAPKVFVQVGRRATVFWPQMRINLLGLKLVPVTPPLLPISLPLSARAFGLLVPEVTFLGPPWPTVDVPLFVPITDSWDLTLAPGIRGDWGFAPRLGLRLRGAPSAGQRLVISSHTTWDLHHRAAARFAALTARATPAQPPTLAAQDLLAQRRALVWRSRIDVQHSLRLLQPEPPRPFAPAGAALEWQSTATWVSDDAVLTDLGVTAAQRVATYLPSRTLVTLRHPQGVIEGGVDGMLRLDSTAALPEGGARPILSNIGGPELHTLHRLPHAHGRIWSRPIAKHWRLLGELSATRCGAIVPRPEDALATGQKSQVGARAVGGLMVGRTLGPLRGRGNALLDGVWFATAGAPGAPRTLVDGVLVADAELSVPLGKRYGQGRHTITPLLRYRALARPNPRQLSGFLAGGDALDPFLERGAVHQAVLGVSQQLTIGQATVHWEIGQPWDFLTQGPGQPSSRWVAQWGNLVRSESLVSVQFGKRPFGLQHLAQHLRLGTARAGLSASYLRAAPGAERFLRTMYELSAAPGTLGDAGGAAWAHSLMVSGQFALPFGLAMRYGMTFALPRPQAPSEARPLGLSDFVRRYGAAQSLDVAYESPCRCWGINATVSASPQALGQTWRMKVLVTVADTRLGS